MEKGLFTPSGLLCFLCSLAQPGNMWMNPENWLLIRPLLCGTYVSPFVSQLYGDFIGITFIIIQY